MQEKCLHLISYICRSVLEYGATIWDPYQKNDIKKLEKIQRRGARFINQEKKDV